MLVFPLKRRTKANETPYFCSGGVARDGRRFRVFIADDNPRDGAAVGMVGEAALGGVVGSAVGNPGAGAAVGLGTGALIGDRLQSLEQKQSDLDRQIQQNEQELQRQHDELERLKKETKER